MHAYNSKSYVILVYKCIFEMNFVSNDGGGIYCALCIYKHTQDLMISLICL